MLKKAKSYHSAGYRGKTDLVEIAGTGIKRRRGARFAVRSAALCLLLALLILCPPASTSTPAAGEEPNGLQVAQACPQGYPVDCGSYCCPAGFVCVGSGCCEPGYSVFCGDYCCKAGSECCPDGCCSRKPDPLRSRKFYYRAHIITPTGHTHQWDGLYIGNAGYTWAQQQKACMEYVKSSSAVPFGSQFVHLSCTPAD